MPPRRWTVAGWAWSGRAARRRRIARHTAESFAGVGVVGVLGVGLWFGLGQETPEPVVPVVTPTVTADADARPPTPTPTPDADADPDADRSADARRVDRRRHRARPAERTPHR